MCQFCCDSNEQMEPNDNTALVLTMDEPVKASASHDVTPEQGNAQKDTSSPLEASLPSPSISISSSESFASNFSEYSVDANSYDDGRSREVVGGSENGQDDSRYRTYEALESAHDVKENHKQGKNGLGLDVDSVASIDGITSSDESSDEVDEQSPIFYERDEIWDPPEAENNNDDEENSMATLDDDDDDEYANAGNSEWAMPRSKEKHMERQKVKNGKFKDLVSQLLRKLGVEICDEKEENWADIVTDLAWKAALYVKPGATEGKTMDPSGYVKVKCVAAGSCGESRLIEGLVFKKHAAHKHMITKYNKPRLLLIQGMLGPSSGSSGLSSFNSMISEDKDSWDDLMQNLQASQPNVILVEQSASRAVTEKILQMGITLVLDMKLNRLERVARCTRSPILSSDTAFYQKLRHCETLYFEKFVEEHAAAGKSGKKPSKTLMFLEGCPTRLGCTILLKGSHAEELKKVKCVVQCAVVMAYHFLMETSFLVDQKAMFDTIAFGKAADISSTNEKSNSSVSDYSKIIQSEEPNVGESLADEVQVLIDNDGDQESSYVTKLTNDTPGSNGLHDEDSNHATDFTAKGADIDPLKENLNKSCPSKVCRGSHMTTLSAASRSVSHALEKVSIVSPSIYKQMSTYIDLNRREPEAQTAISIPVSSTEKPDEHCMIEAKNKSEEDKPLYDELQSESTASTADVEAKQPADDGEESIRAKDEISSVLDSESILVLMSSRNALKGTICKQSHFSHIKFYRLFDVPLGHFLLEDLFNQAQKCEACGQPPEAHIKYYAHHSKQFTIRVKRLGDKKHLPRESDGKLWMWSRCGKCEPNKEKATKRVLISTTGRRLSFGKFLELSFSSHSSFNRLASCGHCFQKDFLYFFGLGSMVAMLQYSRVAIYTVSVPAQKLEFNSSIDRVWLKPEISTVYTTGLVLFNELEKYLKKAASRFSGWNLVLNGLSKGFSDIVDILMLEKAEFEENFKNMNEDSHDSVYKFLRLNRLRWEILLEACVWDRRLHSLLSSSSTLPHSSVTGTDEVVQRQMGPEEDGNPGEEAENSKILGEAEERQILLEEQRSGKEGDGMQKIAFKGMLEQMDLENGHSEGEVAAPAKVLERQTGSNNEGAEEIGVPRTMNGHHDVTIEGEEVTSHGNDRTSEECNDVEVQIEMVAYTGNFPVRESPNEGILVGRIEQDLISLPIVEENPQRSPSQDSVLPTVSFSQESTGSTDLACHLHCDGESSRQENGPLSDHLLEDRNMSMKDDKENSTCSADGKVSEKLASPPLLKLNSSLWNPFGEIREECMEDLLEGRLPKFGHLPKFELLHSPDFLPMVSQVIVEEGLRLHVPLRDGDFIVSDFEDEISTSVACALALTEFSTHPASDSDGKFSLKRAASEPWPLGSSHDLDVIHSSPSMSFTESHIANYSSNRRDYMVSYEQIYNEVTLGIEKYPIKGKYSVVIMYPNEFRSLRDRCCPSELDYIASLSRCKIWDAKGGKSKSVFAKTLGDRLIVKEIKKTEFDSFMKFASGYFEHVTLSVDSGNQTCLAKILGLYQVTIRNPKSGKETKHDLMVQENLSFGRNITRQYDLKGALHARFTADGSGDVLLDQNFVDDMNSSPLYVGQNAKRLLQRAVWNDTTFLKNIGVMDYSLLVGVDRERRELVCGIIDYLRQFTWDKQLETWVKSSLVPKNTMPTIISPQEYKKRFRKFMGTHFLTVPDHWCSHRSFNPCKLCGAKVYDSSVVKSEKREEELNGVYARD